MSLSSGTGYSISENKLGANDYETYDINFRVNLNLPYAYVSIGEALSFNDYFESVSYTHLTLPTNREV